MKNDEKFQQQVEQRVKRILRAGRERPTVLRQSIYLGTLGLLFVLPTVAGAYLGRWLDGMAEGYSLRWTLSFLFLGIVLGAVNVYLFIKE
ncbi:MAG: ATP synthase subunit [Deltaproteobacteria bacterium CG2_30_66_27]|nr:MAG: ATP synthase subunit [Deltaproteobacteria bacterium CG2_30_66_27]PJB31805.1 MAG: F0F1 ATP synthase subunit [Deltaproteobacteria bacterium CG_4_9_14_3_um_filter_65_9]